MHNQYCQMHLKLTGIVSNQNVLPWKVTEGSGI